MKVAPVAMLEANHHYGRQSREEEKNEKFAAVSTIREDGPSKYRSNPCLSILGYMLTVLLLEGQFAPVSSYEVYLSPQSHDKVMHEVLSQLWKGIDSVRISEDLTKAQLESDLSNIDDRLVFLIDVARAYAGVDVIIADDLLRLYGSRHTFLWASHYEHHSQVRSEVWPGVANAFPISKASLLIAVFVCKSPRIRVAKAEEAELATVTTDQCADVRTDHAANDHETFIPTDPVAGSSTTSSKRLSHRRKRRLETVHSNRPSRR
ncbi:hypothetical protein KIN20_011674 [Parelaphostrongylus tenuis]|uniref:Uncharacterized protein n=1 Tax=Parelaphostrongylus tenuis TaxID=148309 RepID=A0AAD5MVD1_PARTN|nr:hypothetical protein KIN20_011674 [Parelaphostrongylus tenuis]